jgi:hypothetical protein
MGRGKYWELGASAQREAFPKITINTSGFPLSWIADVVIGKFISQGCYSLEKLHRESSVSL